jgi:hypothetical protein
MDLIHLLITGVFLKHIYVILTTLFVFSFKHLPINIFDSSSDNINTEDLLKNIKQSNAFISGYTFKEGVKRPEGIFYNWSKKYLGYIENYQTNTSYTSKIQSKIWIVGKLPINIKSLNSDDSNNTDSKQDDNKIAKIKIYLGCGYYDGNFKDILLPFNFDPFENQKLIIKKIHDTYDKNPFNICRTLIWGKPGGGKSFIGKLLAKKYNSAYSFDVKLLDPGTPILNLWKTVMPTKESPLIIQIDEFDIIIKKIHKISENLESEKSHQWLRTIVGDKQSYNTFLSEYLICLPYVIYLFTMNSSPNQINSLDKSYIRKNRIDLILPLDLDYIDNIKKLNFSSSDTSLSSVNTSNSSTKSSNNLRRRNVMCI